jgi:hypothetical protein
MLIGSFKKVPGAVRLAGIIITKGLLFELAILQTVNLNQY